MLNATCLPEDRYDRCPDALKRFWAKVNKTDSCWIWTANLVAGGYGRFTTHQGSAAALAHRYAYEAVVGPIPDGLHLDHLCRNRRCVNPAHLEPVTTRENCVVRGTGFCAQNARKVTCPLGHPYDFVNANGRRCCRRCNNAGRTRRHKGT